MQFTLEKFEEKLIQNKQQYQFVDDAIRFLMNTLPIYMVSQTDNTVYVSFNGGKDATVVLFLTYIAIKRLGLDLEMKTVYFLEENSFEEVDVFIEDCRNLLNFSQVKLERNFKESLKDLVQNYQLKSVIMGNRKNDPYCEKMEKLDPSDYDKGYPAFMRINPIINWQYNQVWTFLRDFEIPYCSLYNEGYTYLGNKNNTNKNPYLKYTENNQEFYKPAYLLPDEYEQLSRSSISKKDLEKQFECQLQKHQQMYVIFGNSNQWSQEIKQLQEIHQINEKLSQFLMIFVNTQNKKEYSSSFLKQIYDYSNNCIENKQDLQVNIFGIGQEEFQEMFKLQISQQNFKQVQFNYIK
ncbi:hypothetical protein PPERSA_03689 [Pseudocohnilembus persalinus]|uniref:FAD synthase n=1 Tax=Pseudocohnilembus persalinus TaxID=266149 RepID=A0A0V0QG30_PSEPJ|nr:hypothetical protein PPERSA_03689 [Pseudocohnilembus persalinus]|eukprot:KRX01185.1 hypothetical protein PPERSA_03689 [Pseudocohnilembus persalinus]